MEPEPLLDPEADYRHEARFVVWNSNVGLTIFNMNDIRENSSLAGSVLLNQTSLASRG